MAVLDLATARFLPHRVVVDAGTDQSAAIALSADGDTLYVGDHAGVLRAYAAESGRPIGEIFHMEGRSIRQLGSPPGDTSPVAVSSAAAGEWALDRIDVVDPRNRRLVARIAMPPDRPITPPVCPRADRLVVGLVSGEASIWDIRSGQLVGRHQVIDGPIIQIVISPDGRHVLANGSRDLARLWPIDGVPSNGVDLDSAATGTVYSAFHGDGRRIVSVADHGRPLLWDIEAATLVRLACDIVRRGLTTDEWAAVLPNRRYEPTCAV